MFKKWQQIINKPQYLPLSQLDRSATQEHLPYSNNQKRFQWQSRPWAWSLIIVFSLLALGSLAFSKSLLKALRSRSSGIGLPAPALKSKLVAQSNAVLLIKTGASVAAKRLPAHFNNELGSSTIPFQIYSDAEQDLEGHQLIDILADIASSDFVQKDDKFDPYRRQRAALSKGEQAHSDDAFWDIDVYKNIPMALDAVERFPDADWYIFADADTYIVQSNLLKYLGTLDPQAHHYLGATAMINDIAFAHGGSGYVLSHSLAHKAFVEERVYMTSQAIERPSGECCGDFLLADALYHVEGVDLDAPETNSSVHFTGQLPEGIRYEGRRLCAPVFSMHHVVEAITESKLWQFEQKMLSQVGLNDMITFGHLFSHFAHPALLSAVEDSVLPTLSLSGWDNYSDEHEEEGVDSFEDCSSVCEEHDECIGWLFTAEGRCFWQPNMRVGKEATGKAYLSGWRVDRFRKIWNERPCRSVNLPPAPDVLKNSQQPRSQQPFVELD